MTVTHLSSTGVIQLYNRDWAAFTFTLLPFFVRMHAGHKHLPLCHVTQIPKQFYGFICPIPFPRNRLQVVTQSPNVRMLHNQNHLLFNTWKCKQRT